MQNASHSCIKHPTIFSILGLTIMLKPILLASLVGTTLVLSGCGGGGGSGSSSPSTAQLSLSFKTSLPSKVNVTEDATLRLTVEVVTNRAGGIEYEWYFNNQRINVPSSTSILLVPNMTVDQQGQYRVVVKDVFKDDNFISSSTTVEVDRKQAQPSFAQTAGTFNAIIGDDVMLDPVAKGFPTPTYQWYKNDQPLTGQTNAVLNLQNTKKEDSGRYYVIAKNSLGQTKSPEYQVNVAIQLATGVWFGTLDEQQAILAVAPNGQFIFNAAAPNKGGTYTTGEVRTTSLLQQGSTLKLHPNATVSALILGANGQYLDGDTTLSFGAGINFTPQQLINSRFVEISTPLQVSTGITIPNTSFATLDLEYDTVVSELATTPQDLAGTWKIQASGQTLHEINIANGTLTGTLFDGNCAISNGKITPATDSTTFYTVEYRLVQPAGKTCAFTSANQLFKGLAFRIPNISTGTPNLYMSSYSSINNQLSAVQPLLLSR